MRSLRCHYLPHGFVQTVVEVVALLSRHLPLLYPQFVDVDVERGQAILVGDGDHAVRPLLHLRLPVFVLVGEVFRIDEFPSCMDADVFSLLLRVTRTVERNNASPFPGSSSLRSKTKTIGFTMPASHPSGRTHHSHLIHDGYGRTAVPAAPSGCSA